MVAAAWVVRHPQTLGIRPSEARVSTPAPSRTPPSGAAVPAAGSMAVTVRVTGDGTVTSTDGHIRCPGSCRVTVPADRTIVLVASTRGFLGWTACTQRDGFRCTVGHGTGAQSPLARFSGGTPSP